MKIVSHEKLFPLPRGNFHWHDVSDAEMIQFRDRTKKLLLRVSLTSGVNEIDAENCLPASWHFPFDVFCNQILVYPRFFCVAVFKLVPRINNSNWFVRDILIFREFYFKSFGRFFQLELSIDFRVNFWWILLNLKFSFRAKREKELYWFSCVLITQKPWRVFLEIFWEIFLPSMQCNATCLATVACRRGENRLKSFF